MIASSSYGNLLRVVSWEITPISLFFMFKLNEFELKKYIFLVIVFLYTTVITTTITIHVATDNTIPINGPEMKTKFSEITIYELFR